MVYAEEPKVYVLFQFPEKSPGIGKLCCVFKPGVPEDHSDATTLLTSWVDTKKPLVIRWPIKSTSSWNLRDYIHGENYPDSEFRHAVALCFSGEKQVLSDKRDELIRDVKESLKEKKKKSISVELFPTEDSQNSAEKRALDDQETVSQEEEIQMLRAKVLKLEESRDSYKNQVLTLENDLDEMARNLGDKENENMTLKEKVEQLEQLSPSVLTAELQRSILSLQDVMKTASSVTPPNTPSSSSNPSPAPHHVLSDNEEMVPLGKQKKGNAPPLQIRAGALRDAIIAGSVGPNQAQLNACVAALLRGFFTEDQLANFSLSGRKGPTANPDGPVKDKLPVDIRAGIKDYVINRWMKWHEAKPEVKHINSAFKARLGGAHQTQKKKTELINKKVPATIDRDEMALLARGRDKVTPKKSKAVGNKRASGKETRDDGDVDGGSSDDTSSSDDGGEGRSSPQPNSPPPKQNKKVVSPENY